MDRLEEAQIVQATLGRLDHRVVVGVAFADVELATNDIVAGAGVADDVEPLDVDFRRVVDREASAIWWVASSRSPCGRTSEKA